MKKKKQRNPQRMNKYFILIKYNDYKMSHHYDYIPKAMASESNMSTNRNF